MRMLQELQFYTNLHQAYCKMKLNLKMKYSNLIVTPLGLKLETDFHCM